MNKRKFLFATIAAAALLASTACVTLTGIGGTTDRHGLIGGYEAANDATEGYTEIAKYAVILGLFDSGYKKYDAKVKEAEARGKKIVVIRKWYVVLSETTAYAK